ncbi:MAG: class I SAM-dependent methyltransferase [Planctomycetes bacterium]|nr:class I SAM-dependent methyltransferase [Planctomycetota bacterium]
MARPLVAYLLGKALSSNRLKGTLYKYWYRYIDRRFGEHGVAFMNYGFAPTEGDGVELEAADEPDRYNLHLYHVVASPVSLEGLDVLEMSCGRGGGASYVARYLKPRRMIGVDRTESAVASCRRNHATAGLGFVCGDALGFPFADASFDAVMNVEASHCYPDVGRFLADVRRVLKLGGYFLYADFRDVREFDAWRSAIDACGLEVIEECEITPNVVRALDLNDERVRQLISDVAPRRQQALFQQFAGAKGTKIYEALRSGKTKYMRFAMKKTVA